MEWPLIGNTKILGPPISIHTKFSLRVVVNSKRKVE